jgi:uncharacterized protein YggE
VDSYGIEGSADADGTIAAATAAEINPAANHLNIIDLLRAYLLLHTVAREDTGDARARNRSLRPGYGRVLWHARVVGARIAGECDRARAECLLPRDTNGAASAERAQRLDVRVDIALYPYVLLRDAQTRCCAGRAKRDRGAPGMCRLETEIRMKGSRMRKYTRALSAVAALVLMSAPAARADTTASTLSVEGLGSVFVTPDVADLSVSVTRSAVSSRQALSAANRGTDAVVRAIRAVGVPASGIQTEEVSVSSQMVRVGSHKQRERLWTASESLAIHVTNIKIVGSVIDGATRAGADTIDGPTFSFSDPSAGMIAATRAAIADARRRADDAAAAMGYQVTGVQSVQLNPQSQVAPVAGGPPSASAGPGTPTTVHPGTEEVDAEVEIVYTIAPA